MADLVGNLEARQKVGQWLLNTQPSNLLITGDHGIGKNATLNYFFQKHGFLRHNILPGTFKHPNAIHDLIQLSISKLRAPGKLAVVLLGTHLLSSMAEKENLINLLKLNKAKGLFPIIIVSGPQGSKFLMTIKPLCTSIKFFIPTKLELREKVREWFIEKKLSFKEQGVIETLIENSSGDVRQLKQLVEEIHATFGSNQITLQKLKDFQRSRGLKQAYQSAYDVARKVLNSYNGVGNTLVMYDLERTMLPVGLYDNYHKRTSDVNALSDAIDAISQGDVCESFIYNDQAWQLSDVHGLFSTVCVSEAINHTTEEPKAYNMEFSVDINRTSLRNMYRRQTEIYNNIFKGYTPEDIMFAARIVVENPERGKAYGLNSKQLDTLIKLGKVGITSNQPNHD